MKKFQVGDRVRVLIGFCAGKEGVVDNLATGCPKCVGVRVADSGVAMVWYKPDEIEKVEP